MMFIDPFLQLEAELELWKDFRERLDREKKELLKGLADHNTKLEKANRAIEDYEEAIRILQPKPTKRKKTEVPIMSGEKEE